MTNDRDNQTAHSPLSEVYDQLGDQFMRAARTETPSRARAHRRRVFAFIATTFLIGTSAAFAVAELLPGEEPQSAPPPVFGAGSEYSGCPTEVWQSILRLDQLSDYADSPGYPVAGCPTLETLQEHKPFIAEFERRGEIVEGLERLEDE